MYCITYSRSIWEVQYQINDYNTLAEAVKDAKSLVAAGRYYDVHVGQVIEEGLYKRVWDSESGYLPGV